MFAALSLFVVAVSLLPLARLVLAAVAPAGVLDLARLRALVGRSRIAAATTNTVRIAVLSALVSTGIGTAAATLVALTDFRLKGPWVFTFILPMIIPPQVTALAWIQALAPNRALAQLLGVSLAYSGHPLFSMTGIVLLLGVTNAPMVFLRVRASLRQLPAELAEAAQVREPRRSSGL